MFCHPAAFLHLSVDEVQLSKLFTRFVSNFEPDGNFCAGLSIDEYTQRHASRGKQTSDQVSSCSVMCRCCWYLLAALCRCRVAAGKDLSIDRTIIL